MKRENLLALAYGLPSFACAGKYCCVCRVGWSCLLKSNTTHIAIHALFVTYHVDLFLNVYHLSRGWLFVGEAVILTVASLHEPVVRLLDVAPKLPTPLTALACVVFVAFGGIFCASSLEWAWLRRTAIGATWPPYQLAERCLRSPFLCRSFHSGALSRFFYLIRFCFFIYLFICYCLTNDVCRSLDHSPLAVGVHFIVSIYTYDALLAYVTLAHASLVKALFRFLFFHGL